jgi:transcriptional regulator with XRE-family HTH domain
MDAPAELLRAARTALGMSQAELAHEAGVAVRTVAKMETNGIVRLETLRKIQQTLEVKGVGFLDRDERNGFGLRMPWDWPKA